MTTVATAHSEREGPPRPGRPFAVDDHGRRLTTTAAAAAHYRLAQRAAAEDEDAVRAALAGATTADPEFALAAAGLAVLGGPSHRRLSRRALTNWERRHLDVVEAAPSGRADGAADLLREHLVDVGCDPLALLAVIRALPDGHRELADVLRTLPLCHLGISGGIAPR